MSILPRVYWTIDGRPTDVADWSANCTVNLGYDQMRGTVSAETAVTGVNQGDVVTGYTENGRIAWQGRISQAPQIKSDGTATIAAQGHGYQAVKNQTRWAMRVADMGAWVAGHVAPLNAPFTPTNATLSISDVALPVTAAVSRAIAIQFTASLLTRGSAVVWAPGIRFTSMYIASGPGSLYDRFLIYTADGPNLGSTMRLEAGGFAATPVQYSTTFVAPGDTVMIEYNSSTALNTFLHAFEGVVLSAEGLKQTCYADQIAKAIGNKLGWDTSGVAFSGGAPVGNFDVTGGAAALTACCEEDLRWVCLEDRGDGPFLDHGSYRKVWEVSARQGTRFDLTPLEVYNHARAQYALRRSEPLSSSLRELIPAEGSALGQLNLDAYPDPLPTMDNELGIVIGQEQMSSTYAVSVAYRMLQLGLSARWRGNISTARAFEAGTGREATFEVNAGDLVRLTDFSASGDVTLRIADVQYGPDGIVIGVEAPALPFGALAALGGGASAQPAAAPPPPKPDLPGPTAPAPTLPIPTYPPLKTGGGFGPGGYKSQP